MPDIYGVILMNIEMLLFLIFCFVVGVSELSCLGIDNKIENSIDNFYLRIFYAIICGIATVISILFILAMIGYFDALHISIVGICIFGVAFGINIRGSELVYYKNHKAIFNIEYRKVPYIEALALLLFFIISTSTAVVVPGRWDDTMYHLPLARNYVENHSIIMDEYLRFPLFPQNMELLFALGLLMGGDLMAQAMATIPLFLTGIGLLGAGVWLLRSAMPGALSILLLFFLPFVRSNLGYAYVDNGLAMFCWGATLAIAIWHSSRQSRLRWLVLAGVLAGCAAGIKIFGGVMAIILGVYLILASRAWRPVVVYAGSALLFGSWWYVRSAVISGDPLHPAGGDLFGFYLWNSADLLAQKGDLARYGVEKNILYLIPILIQAKIVAWIFSLLFAIFLKKQEPEFRLLYIVFLSYFVFWAYVTQLDRYLAPISAVGCFLSIAFYHRIALEGLIAAFAQKYAWAAQNRVLPAATVAVLALVSIYQYGRIPSVLDHWSDTLQQRPGYALFQRANGLISLRGPRIVQIGFENGVYFFNGVAIGDWFGPGRYSSMMTCSSETEQDANTCRIVDPDKMVGILRNFDSSMLMVNGDRVTIDVANYANDFDIVMEDHGSYLLTLR